MPEVSTPGCLLAAALSYLAASILHMAGAPVYELPVEIDWWPGRRLIVVLVVGPRAYCLLASVGFAALALAAAL